MPTFQRPSFIIADLDGAIEFFQSYFDFQVVSTAGPFQAPQDDRLNLIYGVPERAVGRSAILQNGGIQMELAEWTTYGETLNPLRESSLPGCSLVLGVDDLETMIGQLSDVRGVHFRQTSPDGFVYCSTPFGLQLRLVRQVIHA